MNALAAVDHVFSVMGATYGASWDRSLGTAPITDVKTVWADALSDFLHSDDAKRAILWGLKNLPDSVPNARQFRSICRAAPSKAPVMLPSPAVNPEIAAKVLEGLKAAPLVRVDHKAWARTILRDVAGGLRRNPTSVQMAKTALKESA
jgi:hypothetical protein